MGNPTDASFERPYNVKNVFFSVRSVEINYRAIFMRVLVCIRNRTQVNITGGIVTNNSKACLGSWITLLNGAETSTCLFIICINSSLTSRIQDNAELKERETMHCFDSKIM